MASAFSEQLTQFALATDVVDDASFDRVKTVITDYAQQTLGIHHVRMMIESESDGRPALIPHGMAERRDYRVSTVQNADGGYSSHTAFAFATGRPLWIVAVGRKKNLREAERYRDLWSGFESPEIPPYRVPLVGEHELREDIKTSIILPLQDPEGRLGVWNLETTEYLDITHAAKTELARVSAALTTIFRTFVNHRNSVSRTRRALNALNETLAMPLPKLTKPRLFLASSSGAREDVIDAIKALCLHQRFRNKLELVYWKDIRDPGNINEHLLRELSTCRYGICYFSEQLDATAQAPGDAPAPSPSFRDNPNVLFEAGMLHGRSDADAPTQVPARWIPIRESEPYSPKPPFDFASERMLLVPRNERFELDADTFCIELKARLKALTKADRL